MRSLLPSTRLQALQQSSCSFSPRATLRVRLQLGAAATNSSLSDAANLRGVLESLYSPGTACVFLTWRYAVSAVFKLQATGSRRQALETQLVSGGTEAAASDVEGRAMKAHSMRASIETAAACTEQGGVDEPACQTAAMGAQHGHGRRVLATAAPTSACQSLITSSTGLQTSEITSLSCSQGVASEYGLTDQGSGGGGGASNAGVIAGAVVGTVVGLALVAAGVAAFILHKRRQVTFQGELEGSPKVCGWGVNAKVFIWIIVSACHQLEQADWAAKVPVNKLFAFSCS